MDRVIKVAVVTSAQILVFLKLLMSLSLAVLGPSRCVQDRCFAHTHRWTQKVGFRQILSVSDPGLFPRIVPGGSLSLPICHTPQDINTGERVL